MKTYKKFRVPFVVEASKLNRLVSVAREHLNTIPGTRKENFEVNSLHKRTFELDSLDDVLALDNPTGNRVQGLVVSFRASTTADNKLSHLIEAEFDGDVPDITLTVESVDRKWTEDTFAAVEEQIERMIQTNPLAKLRASFFEEVFFPFAAIMSFGVIIMALFIGAGQFHSNQMWLSAEDIRMLNQKLNSSPVNTEVYTELIRLQLHNLALSQTEGFIPKQYRDWRMAVIAIPIIVSIGAVFYLYSACYPAAVFARGDAEEWYNGIVQKRRSIWSVLVGSLAIGIVANLFVFGLTTFPMK